MPAPMRLRIIWNVDLSISVYHRHTQVGKFTGIGARTSAENFCAGWFGTDDQTQWKVRWYYTKSKKGN
jgi:hypothetical protein